MNIKVIAAFSVLFTGVIGLTNQAVAEDITDRMQKMGEVHRKIESDRMREQMRDKTHDGRIKVGPNTSLGGEFGRGHAVPNIRIGF